MKLENPVPSTLSELLGLIHTFANLRHQFLLENMASVDIQGFIPRDLPVAAFAESLHGAINEYILHQRLIFIDSEQIQFGIDGDLSVEPLIDVEGQAFLKSNRSAYLNYINVKLNENRLSEKATLELLGLLQVPSKVVPAKPPFMLRYKTSSV